MSLPQRRPATSRPWMAAAAVAIAAASMPALAEEPPRVEAPPAAEVPAPAEASGSWRLQQALDTPSWLALGIQQRTRIEHLANDFRAGSPRASTMLALRTNLTLDLRYAPFFAGIELMDSRAYETEGTPLTTGIVNPLDFLQIYFGLWSDGILLEGASLAATLGRITLDLGSRRLVARNEFRNTINAFTGLDLLWTSPSQHSLRAFFVFPVNRLPSDREGLATNRIEFDNQNLGAPFWGLFFSSAPLADDVQIEAYLFGLHERDGGQAQTANRQLVTPGLRLLRAPSPGRLDLQFELMYQFGTSRATSDPSDVTDLAHRALSVALQWGYTWDAAWRPRLNAVFDYASGDLDPNDGENDRFDPLFGARRFDWGPTGLYGAFARSNVISPGVRGEVAPHPAFDAFAEYRLAWLASSRDAWTAAGLWDPTGQSGSFIGQQLEASVRWRVVPGNFLLEIGGAWLLRGRFARDVPGAMPGNPLYLYTQFVLTI